MDSSATIGSLSFLALTLASEASHRGILGEGSRIAYQRLADILRECVGSGDDLASVQVSSPAALRARIFTKVEQSYNRTKIKSSALALVQSLKADVVRGSLGISLRKLELVQAGLEEI